MADTKQGLDAAMDHLELGSPAVAEDQLDMLPLAPSAGAKQAPVDRRGPGRPAGARNKRTQEWADYLLARYTSPLVGLAEIANRPVTQLARELSCGHLDAAKLQMAAMTKLAEYVHQKQPTAVELGDGNQTLTLVIGQLPPVETVPREALEPDAIVIEGEPVGDASSD